MFLIFVIKIDKYLRVVFSDFGLIIEVWKVVRRFEVLCGVIGLFKGNRDESSFCCLVGFELYFVWTLFKF